MAALDRLSGGRLYLDANIFSYWLEGYAVFAAVLGDLFSRLKRGDIHGVTSELALAECLVKPMVDRNTARRAEFHAAIASSSGLSVYPVVREVPVEAAAIRAESRARLPDAIHLATASGRARAEPLILLAFRTARPAVTLPTVVVVVRDHGALHRRKATRAALPGLRARGVSRSFSFLPLPPASSRPRARP